jgi:hypothetical protein
LELTDAAVITRARELFSRERQPYEIWDAASMRSGSGHDRILAADARAIYLMRARLMLRKEAAAEA